MSQAIEGQQEQMPVLQDSQSNPQSQQEAHSQDQPQSQPISLEEQLHQMQHNYRILDETSTSKIEALEQENAVLKKCAESEEQVHEAHIQVQQVTVSENEHSQQIDQQQQQHSSVNTSADATATAAAAASFQHAMSVTEAQKQQLENDNDSLRQRIIQLEGHVAMLEEEKVFHELEQEFQQHQTTMAQQDGTPVEAMDIVVGTADDVWEIKHQALIRYKDYFGNLQVPYPYDVDTELPKWLLRQRALWRAGKLAPERKVKLEELAGNGSGLAFLEELAFPDTLGGTTVLSVATSHIHSSVPINSDISAAEAEALAAIGGGNGSHVVSVTNHARAPALPLASNHGHGATNTHVTTNTHVHHTHTTGLSSRSEEKWEQHFQRLAQYKADNGNCLVPTSTELGRWLCRQRHNHRYKGLKEERKLRLMALDPTCLGERLSDLTGAPTVGGVTSGVEGTGDGTEMSLPQLSTKTKYNQAYESKLHEKWDAYFQQLVEYKTRNGHANFPTMHGSLGRWISRQRTLYRSHKLKSDRYEKLRELGFAFEDASALEFKGKLDEQWEGMFNLLSEHKEQTGHCFDVPENQPLGKWLYRQRWLHRQGNLRADRAEKLTKLGFVDKKLSKKGDSGRKRKRKRDLESPAIIVTGGHGDVEGVETVVGHAVQSQLQVELNKPILPPSSPNPNVPQPSQELNQVHILPMPNDGQTTLLDASMLAEKDGTVKDANDKAEDPTINQV
jgi:hypothetical protein